MNDERLLRRSEVRSLIGASDHTLAGLIRRGALVPVPILGSVRFRLSDVQRLLQEGCAAPSADDGREVMDRVGGVEEVQPSRIVGALS
jgi:hypothetical protein